MDFAPVVYRANITSCSLYGAVVVVVDAAVADGCGGGGGCGGLDPAGVAMVEYSVVVGEGGEGGGVLCRWCSNS